MKYDPTAWGDRIDLDGNFTGVAEFEPTRPEERAVLAFFILQWQEKTQRTIAEASLQDKAMIWRKFIVTRKTAVQHMSIDTDAMAEIGDKTERTSLHEHQGN